MHSHDPINDIESGLIALHRTFFQHKGWERLQQTAGITLDRAEAAMLKALSASQAKARRLQDVATSLGIEAPSVSRTAQQLEARGLVSKKPDARDGRASNLHLTAKGRQQLERLMAARRQRLEQLLTNWSEHDKRHLAQLLHKLAQQ